MPRLGGGTYKQSYLVSSSGSSIVTHTTETKWCESHLVLPTVHKTTTPPSSADNGVLPIKSRRVNASEQGRGSLLPVSSQHVKLHRTRTMSDLSTSRDGATDSPTEGLRRRSTLSLDDDQVLRLQRRHSSCGSVPVLPLYTRSLSPPQSRTYFHISTKGKVFTVQNFLQSFVVFAIFYLIYDAHFKVEEAAQRLEGYQEDEQILIKHMARIEERAMRLQEELATLKNDGEKSSQAQQWNNKEVSALAGFLQEGARKNLFGLYGGDPVHVAISTNLESSVKSQITIELFDETPHANWMFLNQIKAGDWSSASFVWHPNHMILASPSKAASHKLEFVEKSHHHHEAWTIGLTPAQNGGYNLYVNLKDNAHVHEADVCLGKVVGGFNTLQRLMHSPKIARPAGDEPTFYDPPIVIKDFTISTAKRSRTRY